VSLLAKGFGLTLGHGPAAAAAGGCLVAVGATAERSWRQPESNRTYTTIAISRRDINPTFPAHPMRRGPLVFKELQNAGVSLPPSWQNAGVGRYLLAGSISK
jgi:hypothetical protein